MGELSRGNVNAIHIEKREDDPTYVFREGDVSEGPPKIYTITVTVVEGCDEFWESLDGKSGCDEVVEAIRQALFEAGFQEGYGTTVKLSKFEVETP